MKHLIIGFAMIASLIGFSYNGVAMNIVPKVLTLKAFESYSVIAKGKAISPAEPLDDSTGQKMIQFRVTKPWRGAEAGQELTVIVKANNHSDWLIDGEETILYLQQHDGTLVAAKLVYIGEDASFDGGDESIKAMVSQPDYNPFEIEPWLDYFASQQAE